MKIPIEKAISDKPRPLQKKIPISDTVGTGKSKVVDALETRVSGVISWPKHFGLPQGNLVDAFQVQCYIYEPSPSSNVDPGGTWDERKDAANLTFALLEEGPHDFANYRVTYTGNAQEIKWPVEYQNYLSASHNYVTAILQPDVVWPATPEAGNQDKIIAPNEAAYFHPMDGPIIGPSFRVRVKQP